MRFEPELRHRGFVERRDPFAAHLLDDDVRDDEIRLRLRERRAGARVEARHQRAHRAHAGVVGVQDALQLGEVARREERQVLGDDRERLGAERRRLRQRLQLQREAFGGVARADAGRLEALQVAKRDRELVRIDLELLREHLGHFLERDVQIAVLVERVDQRADEPPVAQRQIEHGELRQQVVAQRARRDLLRVEAVVVVVRRGAAAPVRIAAGIVLEIGAVDGLGALARLVAGFLAARPVVVVRRHLLGRRGGGARELRGGRQRLLVALGLLEQRVLLQHPLHLGVQLDRRQLQQTDRLLQLRGEGEVLAELELEGLLHALRNAQCLRAGSALRDRPS